jgi:hypothetical protein
MSAQTPPADETRTSTASANSPPQQSVPHRRTRHHERYRFSAQAAHTVHRFAARAAHCCTVLLRLGADSGTGAQLGYDAAVLTLSTTDYLLKSVNVLFPIVAVILLVATAGRTIYVRLLPRILAKPGGPRRLRRIGYAMRCLILSVVAGVCLLVVPATSFAALPLSLTVRLIRPGRA